MGKYIKLFENHTQYTAYTASTEFIKPNVSHCIQEVEVHYNTIVLPQETRLMVRYNVEDASEPTYIYKYYVDGEYSILGVDMFDKVEIDGTEVSVADLDAAEGMYQLSSGEHTIAYTLKDPTSIGEYAFVECTSLTSIDMPNSVTSIGEGAFGECSGLTSVTIPDSVTSIGYDAFYGCSSLTRVEINSNTIMSSTYTYQNNLKSIFGTQVTEYIIGDNVTSIGVEAFGGCTNLISVTIPNSVTEIGWGAFDSCTSLTSIDIPSGVTSIGNNAFKDCESLTSVTIPNSIIEIGVKAFCNCPLDVTSKTAVETINPEATSCSGPK